MSPAAFTAEAGRLARLASEEEETGAPLLDRLMAETFQTFRTIPEHLADLYTEENAR